MTYEDMTYESILARMMERVTTKYPNLDTREGSILFNALASGAMELAIAYTETANVLNEGFVDTASREYIFKACEQIGLDTTAFDASAGLFKGEFDVEVTIGSRWNCDIYNYTITEALGLNSGTGYYEYSMLCETEGNAPNSVFGNLSAITELPSNLKHAKLIECLIEGENESSDDEIRTMYYNFINSAITGGSVSQYEAWCESYDGIGHYKIEPLWDGDNTVRVVILNTSGGLASDELVAQFQKYLDPNSSGMGDGVAPIGAKVTVATATPTTITVSATVVAKPNSEVSNDILDDAIEAYFKELSFTRTTVPYMNVGAALLNVNGVESISNLLINGATTDITLATDAIPVLGSSNWVVN